MLAIASNHVRNVLNPSDDYLRHHGRHGNLSTGATVALVVGGVILLPIVIWGIVATVAVKSVGNAANNNRLPTGPTGPTDPLWPYPTPGSTY